MLIQGLCLLVLLSVLVGWMGRNRKFGFWGYFFSSLLFTPIIGLLLVFASDRRKADKPH
jgi:hypothetical protein